MGVWGVKSFENDAAMDWLKAFLQAPTEKRILDTVCPQPTVIPPGFIGKLLGKKPETIPQELEGDEVLAAAEVVAAMQGRPSPHNPREFQGLPSVRLSADTVRKTWQAVDSIMEDSNFKSCWQETDDFGAWMNEVKDLRRRLSGHD
mgnify:CR=1 FL=1